MKTKDQVLIFNPLSVFSNFSFFLSWRLFKRVFWFLSLSLLFSLLFFVFLQINRLAREKDSLASLEQRLAVLSKQNQEWKIKSTQANSNLLTSALLQELNLEKVGKIHFIERPEKQVAVK